MPSDENPIQISQTITKLQPLLEKKQFMTSQTARLPQSEPRRWRRRTIWGTARCRQLALRASYIWSCVLRKRDRTYTSLKLWTLNNFVIIWPLALLITPFDYIFNAFEKMLHYCWFYLVSALHSYSCAKLSLRVNNNKSIYWTPVTDTLTDYPYKRYTNVGTKHQLHLLYDGNIKSR
jgi:hypothetical protein